MENKYHFVQPEEIELRLLSNEKQENAINGSFTKYSFSYVPILKQLEQLLNIKDVYHELLTKDLPLSEQGSYSTYRDGSKFKGCRFLLTHPRASLILLYFDEVQLCNPLGSKTQHKLVFCYITLLNFPARFCSSLKAVWLVEIYYAKINVAFNMDLILKPIVDDLKKLDDGCVFSIFGETKTIYGTLTAVIEDNLASHEIGGFKNAFGHGFLKCRTCIASAEEIQVALCEESCQLRTID